MILHGKLAHKNCTRWYVKCMWGHKTPQPILNQHYVNHPRLEVFKGMTAYQITLGLGRLVHHAARWELVAMIYHAGCSVNGFRLEITLNRRQP